MSLRTLLQDPAWLFELGFPIHRFDVTSSQTGLLDDLTWSLSDLYVLPQLAGLSQQADSGVIFRCAWHERGLMIEVDVDQTKVEIAPTATQPASLHCYLDTRGSFGIHRANQYCYRFLFEAKGVLEKKKKIVGWGESRAISRAIANSAVVPPDSVPFQVERLSSSVHRWRVYLKGELLHGYNPMEFPDIGFFLVISGVGNRMITLARASTVPFHEDPSLWCRAKLV